MEFTTFEAALASYERLIAKGVIDYSYFIQYHSIGDCYTIESDNWDYLSITEYDPPFNVIANLSGNGNITTPIVTSQNSIILLFESDDSYEYSGFRLVIRRIGSATTPTNR